MNELSINFIRSPEYPNAAVKQRFLQWFEPERKRLQEENPASHYFALDPGECRKAESYLREIISPATAVRLVNLKEASKLLGVPEKDTQALLERRVIEGFPHGEALLISDSSIYRYIGKKEEYSARLKELRAEAMERFRVEINRQLQKYRIIFTVEDDGYHPNIELTSEKDTVWAYASILLVNLKQQDVERLKECKECRSFFWDYSKNKSAKFCWRSFCRDVVNYKNVKETRKRKQTSDAGKHQGE